MSPFITVDTNKVLFYDIQSRFVFSLLYFVTSTSAKHYLLLFFISTLTF